MVKYVLKLLKIALETNIVHLLISLQLEIASLNMKYLNSCHVLGNDVFTSALRLCSHGQIHLVTPYLFGWKSRPTTYCMIYYDIDEF